MTLRDRLAQALATQEEAARRALDYRADSIWKWLKDKAGDIDAADLPIWRHPTLGPVLEIEGLRLGVVGASYYSDLKVCLIHACAKCGADYPSGDLYGIGQLALEAAHPTPHRCPPATPALLCPLLASTEDSEVECLGQHCARYVDGQCADYWQGRSARKHYEWCESEQAAEAREAD